MWLWRGLWVALAAVSGLGGQSEARKLFIGGNWKANGTLATVSELVKSVVNQIQVDTTKVDIVVAPAFPHLSPVSSMLSPSFHLAAQTCSSAPSGPFTGEVPIEMLTDLGVSWVILGHSERRLLYGEKNEAITDKVYRAQSFGLKVVVCVGETSEEKDAGKTMAVIYTQLDAIQRAVADWRTVVIAYEPIWAIGTGKTAQPDEVENVHRQIREWVGQHVSPEAAADVRIAYGGSVTEQSYLPLIVQANVDGFLIGGAALKPGFRAIAEGAEKGYWEKGGRGML